MLEDFEGLSSAIRVNDSERDSLSPAQADYINECVEGENPSALVDRIDEMSCYQPPKGIDYDPAVAEIIAPMREQIESKYLEAPNDIEQISQISDCLADVDEIRYENWVKLPFEDRQIVLQDLEYRIAEIEHRDPCQLNFKDMEEGKHGFYSPTTKDITMNINEVMSNSVHDYKETLDTLIHEGRHAYQDYNVEVREVHSDEAITNEWSLNLDNYISYAWDPQGYFEQPVEVDAREFAENIITIYFEDAA